MINIMYTVVSYELHPRRPGDGRPFFFFFYFSARSVVARRADRAARLSGNGRNAATAGPGSYTRNRALNSFRLYWRRV